MFTFYFINRLVLIANNFNYIANISLQQIFKIEICRVEGKYMYNTSCFVTQEQQ